MRRDWYSCLFGWTGRLNTSRAMMGTLLGGGLSCGLFFHPVVVQGPSMWPSLHDGQVVLMDRVHYRWRPFERGDVVVFRHGSEIYVKRVYATAGETVRTASLNNGSVFLLDGGALRTRVLRVLRRHPEMGSVVVTRVPARSLFVVGDNLEDSMDSRDFGPIGTDEVLGYVRARRTFPPDPATGLFRHVASL